MRDGLERLTRNQSHKGGVVRNRRNSLRGSGARQLERRGKAKRHLHTGSIGDVGSGRLEDRLFGRTEDVGEPGILLSQANEPGVQVAGEGFRREDPVDLALLVHSFAGVIYARDARVDG